jgi:hypothetical protein
VNKLAIFVEGQTEQEFAEQLLKEIAGKKNIQIEKRVARGGGPKQPRAWRELQGHSGDTEAQFFVLIVNCGTDNRVASDVRDEYDSLVASGYSGIVGIRDVYPEFASAEIGKLRAGLRYHIKTKPVEVVFVLGVMEIETWFLAEHTHLTRLDPRLTTTYISARLRFDPSTDDMQAREHPAEDLDRVYRLAGHTYDKSKSVLQKMLDLLDYARLYLVLNQRIWDLSILVQSIDRFLDRQ